MGTVFFDRKDSCHVSQSHIALILQPGSQKIQIFFLSLLAVFVFPKQAVPLINQNHKRMSGMRIDIFHHLDQAFLITKTYLMICIQQIKNQKLLNSLQHFIYILRSA